jgi:hypothetical protein
MESECSLELNEKIIPIVKLFVNYADTPLIRLPHNEPAVQVLHLHAPFVLWRLDL